MTEDTIYLTELISEKEATIEYYTVPSKGVPSETKTIRMCLGDLMVICNVLHDYRALLDEANDLLPDLTPTARLAYDYHAGRCQKIQRLLEENLNYSVENALAKCRKRKPSQEEIGEDALVLATKRRSEKKA